jgi:hypothetical protein
MKSLVSTVVAVAIWASTVTAQQLSDVHQHSTAPPNARFEIVQSLLAAKWTFRLDRFTGHVAQLVRTKEDDNAWEEMEVTGLPTLHAPARPRFQIFTSGLAVKHTFLIDTDIGKTWVVVTRKRKRLKVLTTRLTCGNHSENEE